MLTWKGAFMPVTGNLCAVLFSVWITSNHVDGKAIVEGGRSQPNAETIRYCGVRLRLEIESICRHLSTLNSNYGLYRPPHPTVIPVQTTHNTLPLDNSLIRRGQQQSKKSPVRLPRGVIEDCCRNSCLKNELIRYCGGPENRSGAGSTTPETPEFTHSLHKRTSSAKKRKVKIQEVPHGQRMHIVDNCLHCARKKNITAEGKSSCGRSTAGRRRKIRRRKLSLDDRNAILLPLLLQLLWTNWDSNAVIDGSSSLKNFIPQSTVPVPEGMLRRQRPGATRGIFPRDIYYQRQFPLLQSVPSSDETTRDRLESDEDDGDRTTPTSNHNNSNNSSASQQTTRVVKSQASQVTDAPHPASFAIPAGTNPEFL